MANDEREQHQSVNCPHCGTTHSVVPVSVIQPDDENNLRELFEGKLNTVYCADCGNRFLLDSPTLYRDDDALCLIYYMPLESWDQLEQADVQMQKLTDSVFAETAVKPEKCRLVATRRSFIEKIALHRRGLDDRIVEYIKYQLISQRGQELDPTRFELLYDFSNEDEDKVAFLVYDRERGEPQSAAHVPMDVYREIIGELTPGSKLAGELEWLFPGTYVSVESLLGGEESEEEQEGENDREQPGEPEEA